MSQVHGGGVPCPVSRGHVTREEVASNRQAGNEGVLLKNGYFWTISVPCVFFLDVPDIHTVISLVLQKTFMTPVCLWG